MKLVRILWVCLLGIVCTSSFGQQRFQSPRYRQDLFTTWQTTDGSYRIAPDFQGNSDTLGFTMYDPEVAPTQRRPLVLVCAGGGFVQGARTDLYVIQTCTTLAKLGYVTVAIDYRIGMTNPLDANESTKAVYRATQDLKAAVRHFKARARQYAIDTNQIMHFGYSAGAVAAWHAQYWDQNEVPNNPSLVALGPLEQGNDLSMSSRVQTVVSAAGGIGSLAWLSYLPGTNAFILHNSFDTTVPIDSARGLNGGRNIYNRLLQLGYINNEEVGFSQYNQPGMHVPTPNSSDAANWESLLKAGIADMTYSFPTQMVGQSIALSGKDRIDSLTILPGGQLTVNEKLMVRKWMKLETGARLVLNGPTTGLTGAGRVLINDGASLILSCSDLDTQQLMKTLLLSAGGKLDVYAQGDVTTRSLYWPVPSGSEIRDFHIPSGTWLQLVAPQLTIAGNFYIRDSRFTPSTTRIRLKGYMYERGTNQMDVNRSQRDYVFEKWQKFPLSESQVNDSTAQVLIGSRMWNVSGLNQLNINDLQQDRPFQFGSNSDVKRLRGRYYQDERFGGTGRGPLDGFLVRIRKNRGQLANAYVIKGKPETLPSGGFRDSIQSVDSFAVRKLVINPFLEPYPIDSIVFDTNCYPVIAKDMGTQDAASSQQLYRLGIGTSGGFRKYLLPFEAFEYAVKPGRRGRVFFPRLLGNGVDTTQLSMTFQSVVESRNSTDSFLIVKASNPSVRGGNFVIQSGSRFGGFVQPLDLQSRFWTASDVAYPSMDSSFNNQSPAWYTGWSAGPFFQGWPLKRVPNSNWRVNVEISQPFFNRHSSFYLSSTGLLCSTLGNNQSPIDVQGDLPITSVSPYFGLVFIGNRYFCEVSNRTKHQDLHLELFPNPATEEAIIRLEKPIDRIIDWLLIDATGKCISSAQMVPGQLNLSWQVGHLPTGAYTFTSCLGHQVKMIKKP